jgi:hydroxyacylglutathione hydrolase
MVNVNIVEIKTIRLPLPFKLGSVNCYLVETDTGYVLIDTGSTNSRTELKKKLRAQVASPVISG